MDNLEKFDLERFKNGENAFDNYGNEYKFVSLQNEARVDQCLITLCLSNNGIYCFDKKGTGDFPHCLQMKKKEPIKHALKGWVNIYHNDDLIILYETKEDAFKQALIGRIACKYVKIEYFENEGL